MKKVFILKIDNYDVDIIESKVKNIISKHFPLKTIFKNNRVLFKPNLLMATGPQEAITTNPVVLESIGRIFKDEGFKIFVSDSAGSALTKEELDFIYLKTKVKEVADKLGFELLYPDKIVMKNNLPLAWWVDEFEMVNLAKLKTHQIMVLTLATKNLYGCIVGLHKSYLHRQFPKARELAKVILELYQIINPKLNIVDGIVSLEGEGPSKAGRPKKLGILAIGDDALYTDYAISKLLGLNFNKNPLIAVAKEKNLIDETKLEIFCEVKNIRDFKFPKPFIVNYFPEALVSILRPLFKFSVTVDSKKCVNCYKCVKVCPSGAISCTVGFATIDKNKCIMCMCCQEMCSFSAISLERSFLIRVLNKIKSR